MTAPPLLFKDILARGVLRIFNLAVVGENYSPFASFKKLYHFEFFQGAYQEYLIWQQLGRIIPPLHSSIILSRGLINIFNFMLVLPNICKNPPNSCINMSCTMNKLTNFRHLSLSPSPAGEFSYPAEFFLIITFED